MANTNQPASNELRYHGEFDQDLFGCFDNCGICLCAYFCCPCYAGYVFGKANECCCTPILCPCTLSNLRTKMRAHYKIKGQIWKDACIAYFFGSCALCQIANELRNQGIDL